MKLFLVYINDDEYEYLSDCVKYVVIAENEARAMEIAKVDLENLKLVCICENINQEYCSGNLTDWIWEDINKDINYEKD